MSKPHNVITILIVGICIWLVPLHGDCQENISKGLQWLTSVQQSDGSWGYWAGPTLRDTTTGVDIFQILSPPAPAYLAALQWLATTSPLNNDFAARRLYTFSKANYDTIPDLNYLMAGRKSNGGWGLDPDHESDPFDTALALQALKAVNYPDQNTISYALDFLTSTQNSNGGWGFAQGDDSSVYMTAVVLNTLSQFKAIYDLQTPITKAATYLLTKQNADGGFGSSPSTVYETALAFESLLASGAVGADKASNIQSAINYIASAQLPNGSWDDDPYSTALALRALYSVL